MAAILRLLARCFRGNAAAADEPELVVHITGVDGSKATTLKRKADACIPEVFAQAYGKVVPGSVAAREAVCITQDVAVLGDASVEGGDSCITGNLLVAGSVRAKGSICITGNVLVLGNAHVEATVCVTGNVFVQGDLAVRGKLKVGGKLCVFGSKDIQPAAA